MYSTVKDMFVSTLSSGNSIWQERKAFLDKQKNFIDQLILLTKAVARESGNRKRKTEKLRSLLADSESIFRVNFFNFEPIPFPLDPDISIKGIVPEK